MRGFRVKHYKLQESGALVTPGVGLLAGKPLLSL